MVALSNQPPSAMPVGNQKTQSASQNVVTMPFARASKWHTEQSNFISGVQLAPNAQIFNFPLASYGYLSAVIITFTLSGSGAGTSLTYFEDAPYSLISQIQLSDVNGVPLFQLSGFHAYLAAKYGGYRLFPIDGILNGAPFDSLSFTGTSQTPVSGGPTSSTFGAFFQPPTATSMNCKFVIPIFLEFGRDGLGCLKNMDASARYNLQITVAGGAGSANAQGPFVASGTVPSTLPTMTMNVEVWCRSQPPAKDMYGNVNSTTPPALGTTQYWTSQNVSSLSATNNTVQLTRVGNLIRNHILVWRNATTTANPRATAEQHDLPQLFEFDWDVGQRYVVQSSTIRYIMNYGVQGMTAPNGVLVFPNNTDPMKLALSEYGDEWLPTLGSTKLTLKFSSGDGVASGGNLTVITNDIVAASYQIYQAPALNMG